MKGRTGGSGEKDQEKVSDAEELSREKERVRETERERERRRGKEDGRPPTAAAEIFYELNCAGGLCPRESMCEDQTPRREGFLSPSAPMLPPSSLSWTLFFRGLVR